METPKGFKKVDTPEVVKLEKVGDSLQGEFVALEESGKFPGSWGVHYLKGGKANLVFVSQQGKNLFDRTGIKPGQEFVIGINEEKTATESGNKYWVYELFVK